MQNVTNLQDLVFLLQVLCGEAQLHRLRHREQVFFVTGCDLLFSRSLPSWLDYCPFTPRRAHQPPSIPRVFFTTVSSQSRVPEFVSNITRCIQSPSQARKSHNLRQEPLSSFHLRRLPLFSAGRDLHQVDSSSLVPVYPPSMEMTTRVFASPSVRSGHYKSGQLRLWKKSWSQCRTGWRW